MSDLQLPDVWRVRDLAEQHSVVASGHPPLDEQLPGGGWPLGSLVELLEETPGRHAWQLLAPALVTTTGKEPGPVVIVGSPFEPFVPALQSRGLCPQRLLRIESDQPKALLWSCEQALRCAEVAAVVSWLPQARSTDLRRLQVAAQQHQRLLFVFRPVQVQRESSPAAVRLQLGGSDSLEVTVLKRRGPPLLQPLRLHAHPPRLAALLSSRKGRGPAGPLLPAKDRSHVLDRTVSLA